MINGHPSVGKEGMAVLPGGGCADLLPLSIYFMIQDRSCAAQYNVTQSQQIYTQIRSGDPMTITGISSNASNTDAMFLHESNLRPYEPIFGYGLENSIPNPCRLDLGCERWLLQHDQPLWVCFPRDQREPSL